MSTTFYLPTSLWKDPVHGSIKVLSVLKEASCAYVRYSLGYEVHVH